VESKVIVEKMAGFLEDKKARNIDIINIREITIMADYFIICSGTSTAHIKALSDELEEKMKEIGLVSSHREGYDTARWILLDYSDVVVHIFHEEDRKFYNLERLWSDGVKTLR
jgi:ribosome-associated protein